MNAFETQNSYMQEDREQTQKRAEEIVLKSLTEDHPKVKDLIQQATLELQEKMHKMREAQIKEQFRYEQQIQEFKYNTGSTQKDMIQKLEDLEKQLRDRDKLISNLKDLHKEQVATMKEEF